uniref:C2H2-type domain-containing protein n=1 Tax=Timema monikensis TaxID=170555 RepID=A0A7R9E8L6_9NEOP|nr:unnamed protein product [Timema monikensis]
MNDMNADTVLVVRYSVQETYRVGGDFDSRRAVSVQCRPNGSPVCSYFEEYKAWRMVVLLQVKSSFLAKDRNTHFLTTDNESVVGICNEKNVKIPSNEKCSLQNPTRVNGEVEPTVSSVKKDVAVEERAPAILCGNTIEDSNWEHCLISRPDTIIVSEVSVQEHSHKEENVITFFDNKESNVFSEPGSENVCEKPFSETEITSKVTSAYNVTDAKEKETEECASGSNSPEHAHNSAEEKTIASPTEIYASGSNSPEHAHNSAEEKTTASPKEIYASESNSPEHAHNSAEEKTTDSLTEIYASGSNSPEHAHNSAEEKTTASPTEIYTSGSNSPEHAHNSAEEKTTASPTEIYASGNIEDEMKPKKNSSLESVSLIGSKESEDNKNNLTESSTPLQIENKYYSESSNSCVNSEEVEIKINIEKSCPDNVFMLTSERKVKQNILLKEKKSASKVEELCDEKDLEDTNSECSSEATNFQKQDHDTHISDLEPCTSSDERRYSHTATISDLEPSTSSDEQKYSNMTDVETCRSSSANEQKYSHETYIPDAEPDEINNLDDTQIVEPVSENNKSKLLVYCEPLHDEEESMSSVESNICANDKGVDDGKQKYEDCINYKVVKNENEIKGEGEHVLSQQPGSLNENELNLSSGKTFDAQQPLPKQNQSSLSDPSASTNFRITRKVYLCSACGTYYENWNLFLHMREVHNRHICLYCLSMFSQADKLATHLGNKHSLPESVFVSPEQFHAEFKGPCFLMCCKCEQMFKNLSGAEEEKVEELSDNIQIAGEDTPLLELILEQSLDKMTTHDLLKESVKVSCISCVYCNHAKKIAVNAKQLSLHLLAEHRFSPVLYFDISEPVEVEGFVPKLKTAATELQNMFLNTDTYDSSNKDLSRPYDRTYECFHCHFLTTSHKELYLHNRKMHQKTILLCIMCKSNFYSYSELLCHLCPGIYLPDSNINFRCCLCAVDGLPSAFRLMVHLRKRHNACDVCLETTGDQQKLSNHVWKHKLHHLCYRCGIAYRNKPDITKHLFWKHGTESVLCKKCLQKKWPHVYHFCIPPNAFVCEECNVSFSKAVALKVHKRLHVGDIPYACEKCEERFISRSLLNKHMKKHEPTSEETVKDKPENVVADKVDVLHLSTTEAQDKQEDDKKNMDVDHNYCFNNSTSLELNDDKEKIIAVVAPTAIPSKKKVKTMKKKQKRASSSSSDSSSNSDSTSCSCGTNCSCSSSSSSSSGSSSSPSSDSNSSSSESRRKQAARREKRKERSRNKKKKEENNTTVAEPVPSNSTVIGVPNVDYALQGNVTLAQEETELPIRESDLDTDETETDEDFYDQHPQKLANKLLAEKRNQLLLLAAVAPVNNGTVASSSSTLNVLEQGTTSKKKVKSKRRKKSQYQDSAPSKMMDNSLKLDIPSTYYDSQTTIYSENNTMQATTLVASPLNTLPPNLSARKSQVPFSPSSATTTTPTLTYHSTGSGSETDSKRLSRRRRVPKRFYGDSSDEDEDSTLQPKWVKLTPSPLPSSSVGSYKIPVPEPQPVSSASQLRSEEEDESESEREDNKKSISESSLSDSDKDNNGSDVDSDELNHANIINDVLAENAKKEYLHFCNLKKSQLQEIFCPCDQFSDEVGLDTIYGSFLIGDANYRHLWESINFYWLKICMKKVTAQRHIHDEIQEAGGIKNIRISKKMLDYVRGARKRYHEYLEMKKQERSEGDKKKAEKRKLDIQVKDLEGK